MQHSKEELIEIILDNPLDFIGQNRFEDLIKFIGTKENPQENPLTFDDLRTLIKEIYSMNENSLLSVSDASQGFLGKLNKKSTKKRHKLFNRKIDRGFDRKNPTNKLVLAEGDSWFQFPVNVKDIIDWLLKHKNLAIHSMAYGGDWLSNIIYEGKYIEELDVLKPDFFLMSGGGNDMVGNSKVAIMVNPNLENNPPYVRYEKMEDLQEFNDLSNVDIEEIFAGQKHISKSFYSFLIVIKLQYFLMLNSIYTQTVKFNKMKTILHGYDYIIPSSKDRFSFRYFLQFAINKILDTGRWLSRPLATRGLTKPEDQRKVVKYMIFEFNEMLKEITERFDNAYHIDCRGVAKGPKDWFDELHLKSHVFKKVAKVYNLVINGKVKDTKIIRVLDYLK